MHLEAFQAGCNIVGLLKNNIHYGMCCAWAQMIDYDKLTMLLGAQSATGKIIEKGDILGVSALAKGQAAIATKLGEGHSNQVDKFATIAYSLTQTAILIDHAKVRMVCEVLDVMHLPVCKADAFLVLRVLSHNEEPNSLFLNASEVL